MIESGRDIYTLNISLFPPKFVQTFCNEKLIFFAKYFVLVITCIDFSFKGLPKQEVIESHFDQLLEEGKLV